MFASQALRIVAQTPTSLMIIEPPFLPTWSLATTTGFMLLMLLAFIWAFGRSAWFYAIVAPLFALCVIALGASASSSSVSFSRVSQDVTCKTSIVGFEVAREERPLADVAYADVASDGRADTVLLHLVWGGVLHPFLDAKRPGHQEVAQAINAFLRRTGRRDPVL